MADANSVDILLPKLLLDLQKMDKKGPEDRKKQCTKDIGSLGWLANVIGPRTRVPPFPSHHQNCPGEAYTQRTKSVRYFSGTGDLGCSPRDAVLPVLFVDSLNRSARAKPVSLMPRGILIDIRFKWVMDAAWRSCRPRIHQQRHNGGRQPRQGARNPSRSWLSY